MRKEDRLIKRAEFSAVYQNGRSVADRYMVLYTLQAEEQQLKLGISVSRKVAGSVGRNRLKRLVREAFRKYHNHIRPGRRMIVIMRVASRDIAYNQVLSSFEKLLKKAGLWTDDK